MSLNEVVVLRNQCQNLLRKTKFTVRRLRALLDFRIFSFVYRFSCNDRNKHMYVTWCFLRSSLSPFVGDIPLPGFFCFLISLIFLYLFPSPFSKFEFKCISSYKSAETHPTDFPNFSIQSICSRLQIHSLSALQISRFAHVLRLSLNFSSSLFVIRVNLLHP